MDGDSTRWDQRYGDHPRPRPAPPDVVASRPGLLDGLPESGRALDVACGAGAQSLWLAARGLDVVALDVSPVAIGLLDAAALADGVASSIDARVHDTDAGLPSDVTDLSIIVCQRYRAPRLYPHFVTRLRVGGVLVLTVLSAVGLDGPPGRYHAPPGELLDAFTGELCDVVHHDEADGQASIVVRRTC